jgi:hypothetical protein
MVVRMVGMMYRSSGCEGMYKCIKSKDVRGRFAIFVIGDMVKFPVQEGFLIYY